MGGNPDTAEPAIGVGNGNTLATTKFDIYYHGKPAHAGFCPELGKNAMLAAATAVLNLYAIPRHGAAGTQVNVGTLHAAPAATSSRRGEAGGRGAGQQRRGKRHMQEYAFRVARAAARCTTAAARSG